MKKRDARTQPLATQPMPPRQPARVTEPLPKKDEQARPAAITEPHLTQPLTAASHITEPALTVPALTVPANTVRANTVQVLTGAAFASNEEPSTATELVSQPLELIESAVAEELSPATQPAELSQPAEALEAPAIHEPFDSEPLRQLEQLSAQIEQELRKSNPNYRPVPVPPQPDEPAAEEPLELYLERFMERVTGRKLASSTHLNSPPAVGSFTLPKAEKPAQPTLDDDVQLTSALPPVPPRAPECREQLAAMRDLANESTRSAFAEYAGRKHWQNARMTLLAAGAASLVSSVFAVWHLTTAAPGAIQGSVCAGLLAGLLAFRFFLRCRRLTATTGKA